MEWYRSGHNELHWNCSGLRNRARGFESHPLRHFYSKKEMLERKTPPFSFYYNTLLQTSTEKNIKFDKKSAFLWAP